MNPSGQPMNQDTWELELYTDVPTKTTDASKSDLPPVAPGLQIIGVGTFGSRVTQQVSREIVEQDGERPATAYVDYPIPEMSGMPVRLSPGKIEELPPEPFCAVGEPADRRDRAKQFPLLRSRYSQEKLFRGIAVYEDRKLGVSGEGGGAIPSVASLDADLNIARIMAFLREVLRWLLGMPANGAPGNDLDQLVNEQAYQAQRENRRWLIPIIGGGSGATGNALLQIVPYLVRYLLREMGITNYQLVAFVLGPYSFKGLTPYVLTNYRALLYSLDYMAHHGLRREFINGLNLDMDVPPYDHAFLIDDNTLPTDDFGRVTEAALDEFGARAARTIAALLGSNAWETVAARVINPDGVAKDDGKLRWLTTLSAGTVAVDKPALMERAIAMKQAQLLQHLAKRLSA